MKCRTLFPETNNEGVIPPGTVIDDPEAFVLVELRRAKPADQACYDAVLARPFLKLPSYVMEDCEFVAETIPVSEPVEVAPEVMPEAQSVALPASNETPASDEQDAE